MNGRQVIVALGSYEGKKCDRGGKEKIRNSIILLMLYASGTWS